MFSFVDRDMAMRYFGGGIGHIGDSHMRHLPHLTNGTGADDNLAETEGDENEDNAGDDDDAGDMPGTSDEEIDEEESDEESPDL